MAGKTKAQKQAEIAGAGATEGDELLDELLGDETKTTVNGPDGKAAATGAKEKEVKEKIPRILKGEMVAFKNKAGLQIIGMGNLYYVARMNGKLYYKEKSQVTILPEGWKEGDPIPELPEAVKA